MVFLLPRLFLHPSRGPLSLRLRAVVVCALIARICVASRIAVPTELTVLIGAISSSLSLATPHGRVASGSSADVLERDLAPDKKNDAWTTSSRFKRDLVDLFAGSSKETVLELGAHVGHCTRVLSHIFGSVIAVEHSEAVLDTNINNTADLGNVVHLHMHTVLDSWAPLARSPISVVFIDAAHDYHSVRSDIEQALALPRVHTLVLDDYGAERGVKAAVTEIVAEGRAQIRRFIGEGPPWEFSNRVVDEWEGVVLDPVRVDGLADLGAASNGLQSSLLNTSWVIFPAGVFVSGYFQPHGKILFEAPGVASSSYGAIEWRPAMAAELGLENPADAANIFVLRLEDPVGWRATMQLNQRRTAAILLREDGSDLVMLREEMVRTVGEKLMSFMH